MRQEPQSGLKTRPPVDHGGLHHGGVMLEEDMAGAQDTIYLCNFRVSVDGEWLCLKELQDVEFSLQDSIQRSPSPPLPLSGIDPHRHRQQLLPEQRDFRDALPPSPPPPLRHVSSLCLYSSASSFFPSFSILFPSSSDSIVLIPRYPLIH